MAGSALLASGLAWLHAATFMDTFNAPRTVARPPSPPVARKAPGRRVVLVIVDGLAARHASRLGLSEPPPTDALPLPEARCILETCWPSYSRPSWVTIASGAPPQLSGVHTNSHRGPAPVESVFDVAHAAGLTVDALTDAVEAFFDLHPHVWRKRDADAELFGRRLPGLFESSDAHLTLVHSDVVDKAGHAHGAASPEYGAAAAQIGALLRQLRNRLDPTRDTLLVAADHGHLPGGGHGGPEEEVRRVELYAAGYGITPQTASVCTAHQQDVAPTVAALLGLPPPKHAVGRPIEALLAPTVLDHAPKAPAATLPEWRRPAPGPIALAVLLWTAFLGVLLLQAPSRAESKRDRAGVWLAALTCPATFAIALAVIEPTLSFSAVNPDKWAWLSRVVAQSAVAFALSVVIARAAWRPAEASQQTRRAALTLALCALPICLAAGTYGSLRGGPVLGEPHAAHAMLIGDVLLGVVGFGVAAELLLAIRPRAASDP